MSYGIEIARGYTAICAAPNSSEAAKRYVDYHHMLLDDMPALETEQIREAVDTTHEVDIDELWGMPVRIDYGTYDYFRGSGLVGVGTASGQIIALSEGPLSGTDQDFVGQADRYPDYRNYVPVFLGSAAMLTVMNISGGEDADYQKRGEVLVENGIIEPGQSHHLGYARSVPYELTAGASGVLPGIHVALSFNLKMLAEFSEAKRQGNLTWEYDAAAGYHDIVACEQAMSIAYSKRGRAIAIEHFLGEAQARLQLGQDIN